MKRFICLLLIFALCVSLFSLPVNAAPAASGSFTSWKLTGIDNYTRTYSGKYRLIDSQSFQTLLLACYDINFQVASATGSAPFSSSIIRLNGSMYSDFNTIIFSPGTVYVSENVPTTPVILGGIPYNAGEVVNITELYHSVFSNYLNYSANSTNGGMLWHYYVAADEDSNLLVSDLSNGDTQTLANELALATDYLLDIRTYSASMASYISNLYSQVVNINSDIDTIKSHLSSIKTSCSSILDQLEVIAGYENVSSQALTSILDGLSYSLPVIITDIETGLDFLYQISNHLWQVRQDLKTIHNDLTETNDYLESIEDHLNGEALKGYNTSSGMNFWELSASLISRGFSFIGDFFGFIFDSSASIINSGAAAFSNIRDIWNWNSGGFYFNYIGG